jgi:chromosome partitioning protein
MARRQGGQEKAMTPVIVSVLNHKGGCLKTTTTVNLAAALTREGKRVLVVDLDAQQNLTQSLIGPVPIEEGVPTLFDALMDETGLGHLITPTNTRGLDIIPCSEDFAGADISLVSAVGRESILKGCFDRTPELASYDFVLLDNAPSISLVVMNALVASDFFLVPCSAEYLPMVGLTLLGNSIGRMEKVAPQLKPLGVVLTMYSQSEKICRTVESTLLKQLGTMLFKTKIRVNTKAKAAPSLRKTIFEYEDSKDGRGTLDYTALAAEFLERLGMDVPSKQSTDPREEVANG